MANKVAVLVSVLLLAGQTGAIGQTTPPPRYSGPDPALEKVIRPGKLIGTPKENTPPGSGTSTNPTNPDKPGGATNPGGTTTPGGTKNPGGATNPGGTTPGGVTNPGGTLAPPAPLTAGAGLRIVRWTTFRRITHFQQADLKYIAQLRFSADGSKIAFAAVQGSFVVNADGTGLTQVGDKPNGNPGVIDISADGRKVVWADADQRGLYVSNSDGSERIKLPSTTHIISARITADGKRVFALSPDADGILSMPSDGSDMHRVMTTAAVCKLQGTDENRNFWRSWPSGLDISDDGSRVVFHLLWDAFAMNGDGTALRRLTQYLTPEDRGMNFVRLSGNGKRVATFHQQKGITITDWEGGNVVTHDGSSTGDGRWMQFSGDGSKLALSWGLRLYDGNSPTKVEMGEWGSYGDNPMFEAWGATASGDGRRFCVVVKDQGFQQLVVVDLNPATLEGVPTLTALSVSPRFLMTDGTNSATATVRPGGTELATVGLTGLREGFRFPEWDLRPWGGLNDEGRDGDTKAADGIFSTARVRLFKATPQDPPPGPIALRFFAWNKQKNAIVVDVEGFEARKP